MIELYWLWLLLLWLNHMGLLLLLRSLVAEVACFSISFALASLSALEMHALSGRSSNASYKILWSVNVQPEHVKRTIIINARWGNTVKILKIRPSKEKTNWFLDLFLLLHFYSYFKFTFLGATFSLLDSEKLLHVSHIETEHSNALWPIEIILQNKFVGFFQRRWCNQSNQWSKLSVCLLYTVWEKRKKKFRWTRNHKLTERLNEKQNEVNSCQLYIQRFMSFVVCRCWSFENFYDNNMCG